MNIRRFIAIVESAERESVLTEGRDAPLYHATPLDRAVQIIRDNAILDRASVQAKLYPDDKPHDGWMSNWLPSGEKVSGVNLSRDLHFVTAYETDVVFALDQRRLAQRHKIIPLDHEAVMHKLHVHGNEWPEHQPNSSEALELVLGPIRDLNRYLLWVHAGPACQREDAEAYTFIASHPKFLSKPPTALF